jgi:hypothetical protein
VICVLRRRPASPIALRRRKTRAQSGPPFCVIPGVKGARVERTQCIAADAVVVFENEAQLRLEREVGADEDSAKRVGIVSVKGFAVLSIVPSLEADMVGALFVTGPGQAEMELRGHSFLPALLSIHVRRLAGGVRSIVDAKPACHSGFSGKASGRNCTAAAPLCRSEAAMNANS